MMNEILATLAATSDIWEKLIVLLIGWLMGLLAPAIVDRIKRKRENKLGRKAILAELHDLSGVLAAAAYLVRIREGTLDREFFIWLKDIYNWGERTEEYTNWSKRIDIQLAWSDEEIAQFAALGEQNDRKSAVLQKYPVPLLDSRVSALWSFDTYFQRKLLEIRQLSHRLDDLVDRSRKLHDMTFSTLSDENRAAVQNNIQETLSLYGRTAKRMVDKIVALKG